MADTDFDAVAGSLNNKIKTGTFTVSPASGGFAYIDIGIDIADVVFFYAVNLPKNNGLRQCYITGTSSGTNWKIWVGSQDGTAITSAGTELMYICILK